MLLFKHPNTYIVNNCICFHTQNFTGIHGDDGSPQLLFSSNGNWLLTIFSKKQSVAASQVSNKKDNDTKIDWQINNLGTFFPSKKFTWVQRRQVYNRYLLAHVYAVSLEKIVVHCILHFYTGTPLHSPLDLKQRVAHAKTNAAIKMFTLMLPANFSQMYIGYIQSECK